MKEEILKRLVINQNEQFNSKDVGVPRDALDDIKTICETPHIIVITGHRRAGKSTYMLQIAKKYFKDDFYYIDFSAPALKEITVQDYEAITEMLLKEIGVKKAMFFDEIQGKPSWNLYLNQLKEQGHKCFITGSNTDLLSKEISTQLTGRHINKTIYPFSFREYLRSKNVKSEPLTTERTSELLKLFDTYLQNGGFPEVIVYNFTDILKEMYQDIITKDVIARWDIKNASELEDLAYYLLSNTTNEYNYHSLKNQTALKDPKTIKQYIGYLCKTYLFYELRQIDYSLKKQRKKAKKIYCIDNGFLTHVAYAFSIGWPRYLENLIFIELQRRGKEIYFYRGETGLECDFIEVTAKRVSEAIQVCYSVDNPETEKREIEGLLSALKKYKLQEGYVITYNTEKTITEEGLTIKYIPAYKWLLGL